MAWFPFLWSGALPYVLFGLPTIGLIYILFVRDYSTQLHVYLSSELFCATCIPFLYIMLSSGLRLMRLWGSLVIALPIAIGLGTMASLLWWRRLIRFDWTKCMSMQTRRGVIAIFLSVYVYALGATLAANEWLDTSEPQQHVVKVLSISPLEYPAIAWHMVTVSPGHPLGEGDQADVFVHFDVSLALLQTREDDVTVTVKIRPGFFGMPWFGITAGDD